MHLPTKSDFSRLISLSSTGSSSGRLRDSTKYVPFAVGTTAIIIVNTFWDNAPRARASRNLRETTLGKWFFFHARTALSLVCSVAPSHRIFFLW